MSYDTLPKRGVCIEVKPVEVTAGSGQDGVLWMRGCVWVVGWELRMKIMVAGVKSDASGERKRIKKEMMN